MVLFLDKPSGSRLGFSYTVRTPAPFFCAFDLKKEDMTSLESYIKDYYQQIIKRLKEMEADLNIEEKKRLPF